MNKIFKKINSIVDKEAKSKYTDITVKVLDKEYTVGVKQKYTLADELEVINDAALFAISEYGDAIVYSDELARGITLIKNCTNLYDEDVRFEDIYWLLQNTDIVTQIICTIPNSKALFERIDRCVNKTIDIRIACRKTSLDNAADTITELFGKFSSEYNDLSKLDADSLNNFIKRFSSISEKDLVTNILDFAKEK